MFKSVVENSAPDCFKRNQLMFWIHSHLHVDLGVVLEQHWLWWILRCWKFFRMSLCMFIYWLPIGWVQSDSRCFWFFILSLWNLGWDETGGSILCFRYYLEGGAGVQTELCILKTTQAVTENFKFSCISIKSLLWGKILQFMLLMNLLWMHN